MFSLLAYGFYKPDSGKKGCIQGWYCGTVSKVDACDIGIIYDTSLSPGCSTSGSSGSSLGLFTHVGDPEETSGLAWPSPCYWSSLGSESFDGRYFSVSHIHPPSFFEKEIKREGSSIWWSTPK